MPSRDGKEVVEPNVGDAFKMNNIVGKAHNYIVPPVVPLSTVCQNETTGRAWLAQGP